MTYTNYDIDGWHIQFPQEWKFSLDKDQQPPQIIFDVEEEPVTIYISTWNWIRPETEEVPDVETVSSFFLHAFTQQGIEKVENFSQYYPEGFTTHVGKSMTEDGDNMISCAICTKGGALTVYFNFEQGVDIENYLKYIKNIE